MEPQKYNSWYWNMTVDPLTSFEILVSINNELYPDLMNASMFFLALKAELINRFPELEHLLQHHDMSYSHKVEKAKLIIGCE